jgi:predicted SnoaL-like aldol condensation-catalyzing enzyme
MNKIGIGLIVAGCVLTGCRVEERNLVQVAKQMDASVNAHDAAGFTAMLANDVAAKGPDGTMHNGKDSVGAWMTTMLPGFHVDSRGWQQSGDTVIWMSTVRSDVFARMGVNPIKTNTMAVFTGEKLQYFHAALDRETTGKMIFVQFYADVVNGGNIDAIDKYITEDIIEHAPVPPGFPKGREGVKAYFKMIRAAFPDLHGTPSLILADGDYVLISATWEGTNKGKFMGKPGSNKPMSWTVADVVRLENGKAAEHWGWDDMSERMAESRK